jgi:hypothetical protein
MTSFTTADANFPAANPGGIQEETRRRKSGLGGRGVTVVLRPGSASWTAAAAFL